MNMLESMLVLLRITHSTVMTLKSFQDQEELNTMKESIKIKQMIAKLVSIEYGLKLLLYQQKMNSRNFKDFLKGIGFLQTTFCPI